MIFKILINYILGFVNITVEGFFVERFINVCINNKIFLWKIKKKNSTLMTSNININDFKKVRNIAKKTKCRIKINSKKGLPVLMHRYRKRKLLLIIFIPVILGVLISSRFIWNIEINGIENIDKNELMIQLNQEGVKIGNRKNSIDSKEVINNIRLKRNDISWMSIDLKGTNIIINIVEAEEKPEIVNVDENYNIVANKKGIITKITADIGTAQAKKGDIVEEGDVLIAGYMEGKYTETRYVHAKGTAEAKVWYTKKIKTGLTREITEQTGDIDNRYSININNFQINLYKSLPKFENYDTINDIKKIKLFSNFYLPIEINKTTYVEKNKSKITYGKEELKNILIREIEQQFIDEGIDKLNVTNKIVNIYENEKDTIELEMTYEVLEQIGIEEKF